MQCMCCCAGLLQGRWDPLGAMQVLQAGTAVLTASSAGTTVSQLLAVTPCCEALLFASMVLC
jgi:hypothetical protein